jgi:hypothetical protein
MQHTTIVKLAQQPQITGGVIAPNEEHSYAHGKGWKKLWKKVKQKLSHVNGALIGFKLNIMGISLRLYPAFLTPEQAKDEGIKVEAIPKAKIAWEKVRKFWEKLGGDVSKLEAAIRKGAKHKITKLKKKHGADGTVEYYFDDTDYSSAIGASVAAGAAILLVIARMVSKAGAMKNPYNEGSSPSEEKGDSANESNDTKTNSANENNDSSDDSSGADGSVILLNDKKINIAGIALGSIVGIAYSLKQKNDFKKTLAYTVVGGLIGSIVEQVFKNKK